MKQEEYVVKDAYFRRFFVPVVITILVLLAIAVILLTPPGSPVAWNTFSLATPFPPIK